MSFTNSKPRINRPAIVVAVAVLHAAAIYALVTGLGVTYYDKIIGNLPSTNYKDDTPPPQTKPKELPKPDEPVLTVPTTKLETPIGESRFFVPVEPNLPGQIMPDFPFIDAGPPEAAPSFVPVNPRPRGNPGLWATTNDYPTREIRQGNEGTARYLLSIAPDGRVRDCAITRSSGHPGLDAATCEKVSRRARFEPATDFHGNRVAGTYSGSIKWVIPE